MLVANVPWVYPGSGFTKKLILPLGGLPYNCHEMLYPNTCESIGIPSAEASTKP